MSTNTTTSSPKQALVPVPQALELPPGPKGLPILGHTLDAMRDPLQMMTDLVRDYGVTARIHLGPFRYVVVSAPDDVRHVLVKNRDNYPKSRNYSGLRLLLGRGLLTSEGEEWKHQRKLAQPAFHRKRLSGFAGIMARDTTDMLDRWDTEHPAGHQLDVHREMMRVTLRIVGHTLFSTDVEGDAAEVGEALDDALDFATHHPDKLFPPPLWIPTPGNRKFVRARKTLDALVFRLIAERRAGAAASDQGADNQGPAEASDLLSMLMEATDGEQMSDQQLRDEIMTLVLAGHETTANNLSWTLMLLSRHPEIERRLLAEVDAVLGDGPATLDNVRQLELTNRVVQESMRLYPPAWIMERQALADDTVGGYRVPKGTIVGVCPYTLHRNPEWWDNPEGFDPDRFLPERSEGRPDEAYMPFGIGPRRCIGLHFAMMEAAIVLATIVRRYRLDLVPGKSTAGEAGITLRPKHGLVMKLHRR